MAVPTTDQNLALSLELLFSFYLLGRKIKHQVRSSDHHHQATHDQMLEVAILRLTKLRDRSVSELAELLSTGLSAMSEKIKLLKDKNLLDQTAGSDGREMRCVITPAGETLLTEVRTKMQKNCVEFTNNLSTTELTTLNQLLQKLLAPAPQAGKISLQ